MHGGDADDDGNDTHNAHFGFNERINDAFTKRERGEGEQKDGKEGRGGVRQCRLALGPVLSTSTPT